MFILQFTFVVFICVLILGKQFLYTYPWRYYCHFPDSFLTDNPNMAMVIKEKHVEKAPWNSMVQLKSSAGQQYLSFAKFKNFDAGKHSIMLLQFSFIVRRYQYITCTVSSEIY